MSCVNFIEIGQEVFEYGHLEVSNPLNPKENLYEQCISQ